MNQYKCYICRYFTWAETLPDEFVDKNTHKSCAENLRTWEDYNRPWAEKIAQDIAEEIEKLIAKENGVD